MWSIYSVIFFYTLCFKKRYNPKANFFSYFSIKKHQEVIFRIFRTTFLIMLVDEINCNMGTAFRWNEKEKYNRYICCECQIDASKNFVPCSLFSVCYFNISFFAFYIYVRPIYSFNENKSKLIIYFQLE